MVTRFGLTAASRVLDLAAGTGKFTRQLAAFGMQVIAVEPSESMRAQLARSLPQADVRAGNAESIPLPDACVDATFVAQAFHWFDPVKSLAEMARVTRPGGGLGMIWNERDESVDWVRRFSELTLWPQRRPYPAGTDFGDPIRASPRFSGVERHEFRHRQRLDRGGLLTYAASISYIAAMTAGERTALLSSIDAFAAGLPEPIDLPYVTHVYVAQRRP